jgi:hypothetical protein
MHQSCSKRKQNNQKCFNSFPSLVHTISCAFLPYTNISSLVVEVKSRHCVIWQWYRRQSLPLVPSIPGDAMSKSQCTSQNRKLKCEHHFKLYRLEIHKLIHVMVKYRLNLKDFASSNSQSPPFISCSSSGRLDLL